MNATKWKAVVGTALLGLGTLAVYGQSAPPAGEQENAPRNNWRRGGGPEQELNRLTRVLSLTADQQTGVKALLEQQSSQMRALRAQTQARAQAQTQSDSTAGEAPQSRQAQIAQMEQIRDETDTKISALLDENQKKTFADWVQRRKAAMAQRQSQGGNTPPPDGSGGGPGEK